MIKIFFLLDVLATSILSVYTFFIRGEEAALLTGAAVFIAAAPICLWLSRFLVIQFTKSVLKSRGIATLHSEAIPILAEVNTVAVPLRGVLTEGKFSVTDVVAEGMPETALLAYAASVEQDATHALGRAIYREALGRGLKIQRIVAFNEIPCRGVEAVINDVPLRVGQASWIQERGAAVSPTILMRVKSFVAEGKLPLVVSIGNQARGVVALRAAASAEAKSFVGILERNGIEAAVLTGAPEAVAKNFAQKAGAAVVRADLLPDDKAREVQILRAKKQVVAVLGEEERDIPSLAAGDVAIRLKDKYEEEAVGADFGAADFEIPALEKFLTLREIALFAVKLIKMNRWVALAAWAILVAAALTAIVEPPPFEFRPELAAAGVLLTAVLVWTNSMRMWKLRR